MNYIYAVKPLKEAIKIAAEHKQLEVNDSNQIRIYGIDTEFWPAGEKIESAERITNTYIQNVGKFRFSVPMEYFTVRTVEPEVPEFIKNLYSAMTAPCPGVKCEKCPLNLLGDEKCSMIGSWLKERYPEL